MANECCDSRVPTVWHCNACDKSFSEPIGGHMDHLRWCEGAVVGYRGAAPRQNPKPVDPHRDRLVALRDSYLDRFGRWVKTSPDCAREALDKAREIEKELEKRS